MDGAASRNLGLWVLSNQNVTHLHFKMFINWVVEDDVYSSLYSIKVNNRLLFKFYYNICANLSVCFLLQRSVPEGPGLWLFLQFGHWSGLKEQGYTQNSDWTKPVRKCFYTESFTDVLAVVTVTFNFFSSSVFMWVEYMSRWRNVTQHFLNGLLQSYCSTNDNSSWSAVEQLLGSPQWRRLLRQVWGLCGHCTRTESVSCLFAP